MNTKHPHQFTYPQRDERLQSRNRLRVDYISDGTPTPRCNLLPRNEQAVWVLDNRPDHIAYSAHLFGECINAPSCNECAIYQRERTVEVNLYSERFGRRNWHEVTVMGRCCWYPIYESNDLEKCELWIAAHGGTLTDKMELCDAGIYRIGFVKWQQIPKELRP